MIIGICIAIVIFTLTIHLLEGVIIIDAQTHSHECLKRMKRTYKQDLKDIDYLNDMIIITPTGVQVYKWNELMKKKK